MIVNNSSVKLSKFCREYFGVSVFRLIMSRDVLHVHLHFVNGVPFFYVTPFYSDIAFDECKDSGVVPYLCSSCNFSDILSFFKSYCPDKNFKFLIYEK